MLETQKPAVAARPIKAKERRAPRVAISAKCIRNGCVRVVIGLFCEEHAAEFVERHPALRAMMYPLQVWEKGTDCTQVGKRHLFTVCGPDWVIEGKLPSFFLCNPPAPHGWEYEVCLDCLNFRLVSQEVESLRKVQGVLPEDRD